MWTDFEHQVWKKLKSFELENEDHYLLAVSGGVDSMALATVMKKLRPQATLVLMHAHHGDHENRSFRDQAQELVKNFASHNNCEFVTLKSEEHLNTENDYRNFRRHFFKDIMQRYQVPFYVTAHHRDDLLETLILKMIRGASLESLNEFQEWNEKILRLFLDFSKEILETYCQANQIQWVVDPTNFETQQLRNWLRQTWLPLLEKKHPGALKGLAHSLTHFQDIYGEKKSELVQLVKSEFKVLSAHQASFKRLWWESLTRQDQKKVLIYALQHYFQRTCTVGQINEICNYLDKNQNEHTFSLSSINWVIKPHEIMLTLNDQLS